MACFQRVGAMRVFHAAILAIASKGKAKDFDLLGSSLEEDPWERYDEVDWDELADNFRGRKGDIWIWPTAMHDEIENCTSQVWARTLHHNFCC